MRKLFSIALLSVSLWYGIGEHLSEVEGREAFGGNSKGWVCLGMSPSSFKLVKNMPEVSFNLNKPTGSMNYQDIKRTHNLF